MYDYKHMETLMFAMRVAAATGMLLAVAACGGQPAVPVAEERPDTVAHAARWHYHFTSLEELVATSDLVVVGEVTAVERGRLQPDPDPASRIGLRDVTLAISETLKGTAPGTAIVIEEVGYDADGSFELDDMPWSQLGDVGVFFLKQFEGQPAGHFRQIHPDGRILTHYRADDGQSRMYDGTVEMFSDTQLGETLAELTPGSAVEHVQQAAATAVTEQVEPQRPFYEILSELEPAGATGPTGATGGDGPVVPGGTSTTPDGTSTTPDGDEEVTE